jgi:hypothetical protein
MIEIGFVVRLQRGGRRLTRPMKMHALLRLHEFPADDGLRLR